MSEIILQSFYISAAAVGAPATVEFSSNSKAPESLPPAMRASKCAITFQRGFDCSFLAPLASCTLYDIVLRRKS